MHFRRIVVFPLVVMTLLFGWRAAAQTQNQNSASAQNDLTQVQRLEVVRSKLNAMRRTLSTAIASIPVKADSKDKKPDPDDPKVRLQGLDKEASRLQSDESDLHLKVDRSERFDATKIDSLEASVKELDDRVQAALQATASARTGNPAPDSGNSNAKAASDNKKHGFFHLPFVGGGGKEDKYRDELTSTAPG